MTSLDCDRETCEGCEVTHCSLKISRDLIRRERMIRDDSTQPAADEPYTEPFFQED